MAELKTQILIRNDSAENWTSKNPVLGVGEFGVEVGADDNKLKIGDGQTPWDALPYTYNLTELQRIALFENDLTMTMQFGKYTPDASGSVVVPAAGMTAEEVLLGAFSEPKNPTVKDPTLSLTTSGNQSGEVGTAYALPHATASVTTGSYEYGSKDASDVKYSDTGTGITFTSIKVSCEDPAKETSSSNSNANLQLKLTTTELPDTNRKFETTAKTIKFSAEATHPASARTPVNNLGTKVDDLAIDGETLTATASLTITGYRCWFTYVGADCTSTVDSAFIRNNATNKGNHVNAGNVTLTVRDGNLDKRVLIAIPATGKNLTKVIDVKGMGLDIFAGGKFTHKVVSVEGANGYSAINYDVWVYENANGFAGTTLNCTIG